MFDRLFRFFCLTVR